MRIIIATQNNNKLKEIKEILEIDVISLADLNFNDDIEEFGKTFQQNALIKAQAISLIYPDDIIIADDSGLEVTALNYRPGIYSKRYGYAQKGYSDNVDLTNNKLLLSELEDSDNREAQYVCSIAVCSKYNNICSIFTGTLKGHIGYEIKAGNGFGYDSVFLVNNRYLSDFSSEEKNSISHRHNALLALKESGILNV